MFNSPLIQDILQRNAALGLALGTAKRIEVVTKHSWSEPVTVQVLEDDLVSYCNHAGAENVDVDVDEFDPDSGRSAPTGSSTVLMCDKDNCNAQYNPWDEEWVQL